MRGVGRVRPHLPADAHVDRAEPVAVWGDGDTRPQDIPDLVCEYRHVLAPGFDHGALLELLFEAS